MCKWEAGSAFTVWLVCLQPFLVLRHWLRFLFCTWGKIAGNWWVSYPHKPLFWICFYRLGTEPTGRLLAVVFHSSYVAYVNTRYVMDGVMFLNNIWVYCIQFLCDELADMTIPRWTAHPIPPARSPIREILPMIPATAMATKRENRSAKKVRKGNIHSSCRSSNPPSARACLSDKASVCSRLCCPIIWTAEQSRRTSADRKVW